MTTLLPYQQRVIEERDDLDCKINNLSIFISGSEFDETSHAEQDRLYRQLESMESYLYILNERIEAFKQ
jgi:hypothetical protein